MTPQDNTTPRLGVVAHPTERVSLYASYSESFEVNGFVTQGTNANTLLEPTTGFQYEAGAKVDLLDRKLGVTTAVFDMTREGAPFFDSVRNLTVQLGEQRHKGFEIEAFGRVTSRLSLIASFMYLDATVVKDADPAIQGKAPPGVPDTTFSMWGTYDFKGERARGLAVSLGAHYESNRTGDATGTFYLGSYTRWDAGASYTLPLSRGHLVARVNVNNVFDRLYYFGRFGRNNVNFGDPLMAKFSAAYTF